MEFTVRPYTPADEAVWDRFVMQESGNGTFLQTRRFLAQHPADRIADASLVIENEKGALAAVVPAAVREQDGKRVFVSHPGSACGGPVVRSSYFTAERMLPLCGALDACLAGQYDRAELRLTPEPLCTVPGDLLEYALYYCGYTQDVELDRFVPTAGKTAEELFAQMDGDKKRSIENSIAGGAVFTPLGSDAEAAGLHRLLTVGRAGHDREPGCTLPEPPDLKNERLPDEVRFYGVRQGDTLVAAAMLFYFQQTQVLHVQDISVDPAAAGSDPVPYLYYNILLEAARLGCKGLSGDIPTGEGYGDPFTLRRTCCKNY